MIILGDPRIEQAQMFQRGLLNTIGTLAQQQLKDEFLKKQLDLQLQKQMELSQLEEQRRNEQLNKLLGYTTPTIEMVKPQPVSNNLLNPQLLSLKERVQSFLPIPKIGEKRVGGLLSNQYLKTGIPTIKDNLIAQAYGFKLPVTEKPKPKKYEAKVINGQYFTFDPYTGEWIKKGEVKKVIKENPQRMLVDTGDKRLLIDKTTGKVIKEYKVNRPVKTEDISMTEANDTKKLKALGTAINKMMKKYKFDKGMLLATEPQARNIIEEIRKINPQDANRLERWYEEYNRIVEGIVGIQNNPRPITPSTLQRAIDIDTFQLFKNEFEVK